VWGETKPVTETRDYGYLMTGIRKLLTEDAEQSEPKTRPFSELTKDFSPERKAKINQQSEEFAKYMLKQGPIMTDEDLDRVMNPSYMQGDIECKFTEYEVAFLNECLDTIQESHPSLSPAFADPDEVALFENIEKKITELKAVEAWLLMSTSMVQMTLKTLEVQRAGLEALQAGNKKPT
jgi:hypothetical protein